MVKSTVCFFPRDRKESKRGRTETGQKRRSSFKGWSPWSSDDDLWEEAMLSSVLKTSALLFFVSCFEN